MKLPYRHIIIFTLILAVFGTLSYALIDFLVNKVIDNSSLLIVKSVEERLYDEKDEKLVDLSESSRKRIRFKIDELIDGNKSILNILLIDTNKKIVISNDKSVEGNVYHDRKQLVLFNSSEIQINHQTWISGIPVVDIIMPLSNEEGIVNGYLRVVISRSDLEPNLDTLQKYLIPLLIILVVLMSLIFIMSSRSLRKPITYINNAISKIEEEDYSYQLDYKSKDEYTDTFIRLNKTIAKVGYLKEGYKQAEKRILSLLQAVNESIVVLDLNKSVTSFNDAAVQIFNTKRNKFSVTFEKVLDINTDFTSLISDTLRMGAEIRDKQVTIFFPDKSDILIRMNLQPLKENGNILGAALTFKDQHLANELENNLIRSMKYGVITNLASSISHEIKNPLSALALHNEILHNRLSKLNIKGDKQILKSLTTLGNEINRLNRIIQQFFSLAKPSQFELTLVNVNDIIKDVIQLVEKQANEQKISISSKLSSSLELVYGDEDQFKQVFLNIILNAFAAMKSGGKVQINSKIMNGKVTIEIRDTGEGIPEQLQKKVFELYFSTKQDGAGIGLAVCKNIIKAHEGKISLKSDINKGTTFSIELPTKEHSTIYNSRKSLKKKKKR